MKLLISTLLLAASFSSLSQFQIESMTGLHESIAIYDASTFGIVEATGSKFTTNGGDSFSEYELLDTDNNYLTGFIPTDLEYIDAQTLLCSGYWIDESFEGILKSTNGGQNWEYVYENSGASVLLHDINIGIDGTIYAVGKNGKILKSINSGDSWEEQITDGAGQHWQVFTWNENNFTVGTENGFLTTSNGGTDFNFTATNAAVLSVAYKNVNTIMACSQSNQIFFSDNGGEQWTETELPEFNIIDLAYVEADTWVLAAWEGIWVTPDNGQSWFPKEVPVNYVQHALVYKDGLGLGRANNFFYWSNSMADLPVNSVRLNEVIASESLCAGQNDITLDVSNVGSNQVTELEIDIRIDNMFSETVFWTGVIPAGTYNFQASISVNVEATSSEEEYRFDIVAINGTTNSNTTYDDLVLDLQAEGFSGEFIIGPTGDFSSIAAFREAFPANSLCGDLTIFFEDGEHLGEDLFIDARGHNIRLEGLNGVDSDVTVYDVLSFRSSMVMDDSEITMKNLNVRPSSAGGSARLSFGSVGKIKAENLTVVSEDNSHAVDVFRIDHSTFKNCDFTSSGRGMLFSGSSVDSLFMDEVMLTSETTLSFNNELVMFEYPTAVHYFEITNSTLNGYDKVIQTNPVDFFTARNSYFTSVSGNFQMMDLNGNNSFPANDRWTTLENNVFINNRGNFIKGAGNVQIRNNTFRATDLTGNSGATLHFTQNQEYVDITNNIFVLDNSFLTPTIGTNNLEENVTVDYNSYYAIDGSYGSPEEQLEEWQESSGLDLNSILVDVQFDAELPGKPLVSAGNSALQNYSPLPSPTHDILGNPRLGVLSDLGPYELNLVGLDMGIYNIFSESSCLGATELYAGISNLGSVPVTSYDIVWWVDGVAQPSVQATEELEAFGSAAVLLGSVSFSSSTPVDITAELININGSTDSDATNNSVSVLYTPSANFSQLHVGAGQQYETIEEAMLVLENQGMCGPMELIIHPGDYTIPIAPAELLENSEQYPLTIRSSSGVAEDVSISVYSFGWRFENFINLTFKDLTISSSGSTCLSTLNNPESLQIENCELNGSVVLQELEEENPIGLVSIKNCTFNNEIAYASALTNFGNNQILSVEFENNQVSYPLGGFGLSLTNVASVSVKNNSISMGEAIAIKLKDCLETVVENNGISIQDDQGIYYDLGEQPEYHLCQNNFVQSSTNEGILIRFSGSSSSADIHTNLIYHNTTRGGFIGLSLTGAKGQVFNNILAGNESPLAVYLTDFSSEDLLLGGNIFDTQPGQIVVSYGQDDFTLEAFEAEFGIEANSIVSAVPYTSESSYETSYALVDGLAGGVSLAGYSEFDILGNPRDPEFPDVGCLEIEVELLDNDVQVNQLNVPTDLCGGVIDFYVEFFNTGINPVTELTYELILDGESTTQNWSGNLNPGESLIIDFLDTAIPLDYTSQLEVQLLLVNGTTDDNLENNYASEELAVPPLSGLFFMGGDSDGRFQNLQEVADFIAAHGTCGDIEVRIMSGEYNWTMDAQNIGTSLFERKITSDSENAEDVVLSSEDTVINFEQVGGFTFEHITFSGGLEAVSIFDSYQGNKFESCVFSSENSYSLVMDGNITVEPELAYCTFLNPPQIAHGNETYIHHCTFNGGLILEECTHCYLLENEVVSGTATDLPYGIFIGEESEGITLENNFIIGDFTSGLRIDDYDYSAGDPEEKWIINNIIDITGSGTGISFEQMNFVNIYYNTVKTEQGLAFNGEGLVEEVRIQNNLLYSENSHAFTPTSFTGSRVFNNIFYSETTTALSESFSYNNVEEYNELFFTYGNMLNNVEINPEFVEGSYAIANSDALGLGEDVGGVTTDIYGNNRNLSAPTCGAIEIIYQGPPPGDANGDGIVNNEDLMIFLGEFGSFCYELDPCYADFDGDGAITVLDLFLLLANYGD